MRSASVAVAALRHGRPQACRTKARVFHCGKKFSAEWHKLQAAGIGPGAMG
jgi:hypothetical protein